MQQHVHADGDVGITRTRTTRCHSFLFTSIGHTRILPSELSQEGFSASSTGPILST